MFSSRLPATLAPNLVSQAVAALRQSGARLLDLTETNPTVVGLPYPDDVLASLSDPRAAYARSARAGRAPASPEYASRGDLARSDRAASAAAGLRRCSSCSATPSRFRSASSIRCSSC
jgi:hypothetical protein